MSSGRATAVPGVPKGEESYWGKPEWKKVNLDWPDLNEYEQLARKAFEEGITNNFETCTPDLDVAVIDGDVVLMLELRALGDGDNGPMWKFSLREAFSELNDGWDNSEIIALVGVLIKLAKQVQRQIARDGR